MRSFGWVVVLVAMTGCATGTGSLVRETLRFELTDKALDGWKRIETTEFSLVTDLDTEQAQLAASLISQSLAGLNALFARAPVVDQPHLTIIAMRDGLEFERRFTGRVGGFAITTDDSVTLVLYGTPEKWFQRQELAFEGTESVVNHELGHAVLRRYFRVQPRWFAEGMAEFLETFRWLDAETVRLGDPNLSSYRAYRAIRSLGVRDLEAWESMRGQRDLEVAGHYGLSWAFVHYLRNREPQLLGQYMAQLAQVTSRSRIPTITQGREDELDKAIFAYMKQGSYQQFTIKVPSLPAPATASVKKLSESEMRSLMSRLDGYALEFKR